MAEDCVSNRGKGSRSASFAEITVGAAAGFAALNASPGITAVDTIRTALFPALSGRGRADHVALTFDDGPDQAATPLFLEELRARGLRATFFLLGSGVAMAPHLAEEIVAAGHEVAVHTWNHQFLPAHGFRWAYDDLARTKDQIAAATGQVPWLFRPPYGVLSMAALIAARRLCLTPVLWTNWGREWVRGATAQSVYSQLTVGFSGGATVLLHDSDRTAPVGSWKSALAALPMLIEECERRDLRVGPLGEHGRRWQPGPPALPRMPAGSPLAPVSALGAQSPVASRSSASPGPAASAGSVT